MVDVEIVEGLGVLREPRWWFPKSGRKNHRKLAIRFDSSEVKKKRSRGRASNPIWTETETEKVVTEVAKSHRGGGGLRDPESDHGRMKCCRATAGPRDSRKATDLASVCQRRSGSDAFDRIRSLE